MRAKLKSATRVALIKEQKNYGNGNPSRWWLWSACGTCRVLPLRNYLTADKCK
jgi:hypothetical protein